MTEMKNKNPARRRMRINAVFAEWTRSPLLLTLPAAIIALAFFADVVADRGFIGVASSLVVMSYAGIGILVALLAVALIRL